MLYGLEVCPVSDSGLCEMEKAHRMNSKIIQNVPQNIPSPAPLATLGWMSVSAVVDRMKLLFMWRVLCSDENNVYKMLMIYLLKKFFCEGVSSTMHKLSPTASIYKTVYKYELQYKILQCIESGNFGDYLSEKNKVKLIVKTTEFDRWRATLLLYKELQLYSDCVHQIDMNPWIKYLKNEPNLSKCVGSVLSVLMGGQPKYFQRNFDRFKCQLCSLDKSDDAVHILTECPALDEVRANLWRKLLEKMPSNMNSSVNDMIPPERVKFILSCLNGTYIAEWNEVYRETARYVHFIYHKRALLYDEMATTIL